MKLCRLYSDLYNKLKSAGQLAGTRWDEMRWMEDWFHDKLRHNIGAINATVTSRASDQDWIMGSIGWFTVAVPFKCCFVWKLIGIIYESLISDSGNLSQYALRSKPLFPRPNILFSVVILQFVNSQASSLLYLVSKSALIVFCTAKTLTKHCLTNTSD